MRPALALLASLAFSACAAGGPAGAPVADLFERPVRAVPEAPAPATLRLSTAAEGVSVPVSVWRAEKPRAVILALHGFGDYGALTYAEAARAWASGGITTYAPDQRGFGRGETRGAWPGAEALIADAAAYARAVAARHPDLPLVLMGHSMGGGVALAAAGRGAEVDALVLVAPAIWGGGELNPFQRAFAWAAALVAPDERLTGEGVVEIVPTDNRAALLRLARDPWYLAAPTPREILGLVRVLDAAAAAAEGAAMPALLLLGEKDQIVPVEKTRTVFARLPGETRAIAYPEGWHLLLRDRQAARVWADAGNWVLERAAEAAPVR